jgi:hypothetical protein
LILHPRDVLAEFEDDPDDVPLVRRHVRWGPPIGERRARRALAVVGATVLVARIRTLAQPAGIALEQYGGDAGPGHLRTAMVQLGLDIDDGLDRLHLSSFLVRRGLSWQAAAPHSFYDTTRGVSTNSPLFH